MIVEIARVLFGFIVACFGLAVSSLGAYTSYFTSRNIITGAGLWWVFDLYGLTLGLMALLLGACIQFVGVARCHPRLWKKFQKGDFLIMKAVGSLFLAVALFVCFSDIPAFAQIQGGDILGGQSHIQQGIDPPSLDKRYSYFSQGIEADLRGHQSAWPNDKMQVDRKPDNSEYLGWGTGFYQSPATAVGVR